MSGHWRIDPHEIGKHDHLLIETDEGRGVALNDPRRFGSIDLVATDGLDDWPAVRRARARAVRPRRRRDLKRRLAGRKAAIKLLLLDQRIVAGLGNIYVCEALFRARINPQAGRRVGVAATARAAGRRRSAKCSTKRSRPADRPCATSPGPTASSAIFPRASMSTTARASRAGGAAARSGGSSRAGARLFIARAASAERRLTRAPSQSRGARVGAASRARAAFSLDTD